MRPFFADKEGRRRGANYPSQVRLVLLLLLLLLVVVNLQLAYLFERSRHGLEQELDSRLRLAASWLEESGKDRGGGSWGERGAEAWPELDPASWRGWLGRCGLERLIWIPRGGNPVVLEATGRGWIREEAEVGGWRRELERAWGGETVSTPTYRAPSGRYFKALLLPQPAGSEKGGVGGLIALVAPADSLGQLSRFSSLILYGFLVGVPAALLIAFFFVDFVLSPYRRLSAATPSAGPPAGVLPDVEAIVATYEGTIRALQQKEAELARLYQIEQRRAHDLESYQRHLLNHMSSGVLSLDSAFRIRVCNPVAAEILGVMEAEVQGKDAREVFARMPNLRSLLEATLQGGRILQREELEIERPEEGDRSWIGLSSSLLRDEDGRTEGAIFLMVDLTPIRRLQEQVRLRESLAALGEIAAGLAHELRNSLSTLLAHCRLLQRRLPGPEARGTVEEMVGEIMSLERLVQEFLQFARPAEIRLQPLYLPHLLEEMGRTFSESLAEAGIEMEVQAGSETWISADPTFLRQALVNLINNAKDAMPGGGRLGLEAKVMVRKGRGGRPKEKLVRISVSDNGKGMGEEERRKAFLPFFSTKEKGTGLGLAMVQKAALGMGGQVEVESAPGAGTTFHLYFPLTGPAGSGRDG
jgi:PAS domain S-box-containing protein